MSYSQSLGTTEIVTSYDMHLRTDLVDRKWQENDYFKKLKKLTTISSKIKPGPIQT